MQVGGLKNNVTAEVTNEKNVNTTLHLDRAIKNLQELVYHLVTVQNLTNTPARVSTLAGRSVSTNIGIIARKCLMLNIELFDVIIFLFGCLDFVTLHVLSLLSWTFNPKKTNKRTVDSLKP